MILFAISGLALLAIWVIANQWITNTIFKIELLLNEEEVKEIKEAMEKDTLSKYQIEFDEICEEIKKINPNFRMI